MPIKFAIKSLGWVLTLLICQQSFAQQQEVSVHAKLDAVDITIGDQIKLFIEARKTGNHTLLWATLPDTFNHLEIVSREKIDTLQEGATTVYKQKLLLTGFDSGLFKVPSFQFATTNSSGSTTILSTDSFLVNVSTVPVDTTQPFKGIKNIIAVKPDWKQYLPWIFGGIALLVLLIFLVKRFTQKKPAPVITITPETSYQKTLRLLESLEQKKLWQSGNIKLYYVELTDILRGYIEERFKTPAMELTTDELLTQCHNHKEMSKHYDELSQILTTADLAKFAKAQPLPFEHTQSITLTRNFVEATKPVIVETNPQSA